MNYRIVKLQDYSGEEASIYSILEIDEDGSINGDGVTWYERFVLEYQDQFSKEINNISDRIYLIGHEIGARDHLFKEKEGHLGDLVCALYDNPDSKLRLYCIRFGRTAVILGGGGEKPKNIRAWQEDPNLKFEANKIIKVSKDFYQRRIEGEINWQNDGKELEGNLNFYDYE